MKNQEAFTYCWTDHKTNMLYVGYHKGSQYDGYICSQPLFLEQYNKRPEDFTRMVLAEGTAEGCHALEIAILKVANAKHSKRFYNQSDGSSPDFVCKGHTEETKLRIGLSGKGKNAGEKHYLYGKHPPAETIEKLRAAHSGENAYWYGKHLPKTTRMKISLNHADVSGENNPNYGKTWKDSEETKRKKSIAKQGKNNPMYGKNRHHTEKSRKQMSESRKGKHHTEETIEKMKASATKCWASRKNHGEQ